MHREGPAVASAPGSSTASSPVRPDAGHQPGHVLRRQHEAARQQRGDGRGARLLEGLRRSSGRPTRSTSTSRHRPWPDDLRPLRLEHRLGRHGHRWPLDPATSKVIEQGRRRRHAGLDQGPRPRDRQARRLRRHALPVRRRRRQPRAVQRLRRLDRCVINAKADPKAQEAALDYIAYVSAPDQSNTGRHARASPACSPYPALADQDLLALWVEARA